MDLRTNNAQTACNWSAGPSASCIGCQQLQAVRSHCLEWCQQNTGLRCTVIGTNLFWKQMLKRKQVHILVYHTINNLKPSGHYMYHQFNIKKLYVQPTQCIYVFCVDLRTNSDYFPIQHWVARLYNRDGVYCAVRTVFVYVIQVNISLSRVKRTGDFPYLATISNALFVCVCITHTHIYTYTVASEGHCSLNTNVTKKRSYWETFQDKRSCFTLTFVQ